MSLPAGARLGVYEIQGLLGAGGMGEVYRARDARLDRDVAVKVLPAAVAADRDRMARFEQEARATAALNHPNILAVHDIGEHEGAPFIVTFSNRLFPEKAIALWWSCDMEQRTRLVGAYFHYAGGWERITAQDRSERPGVPCDPLFAVWAYRSEDGAS